MRYEDLPRDEKNKSILIEKVQFPISYQLLTPIDKGGAKCNDLKMREPTVLDVEISNNEEAGLGRTVTLLSRLLELTPDEVRGMGTRDFARLDTTVAAFL